ncbi:hypothetical protein HHK36_025962 [Tetracentron sinense]|uniref:Uncharacterized protein n=1 Tax=Tetracentron sinense TaxID=13715 RepID=A0A835D6X3_TETSI|nr:hypothetical protein HHK36_025962 [Tetracentron sinense]
MESKKKVIPIFVDIKPSELHVMDFNGRFEVKELQRFRRALKEAKYTVGLTFDSSNGFAEEGVKNESLYEVALGYMDEAFKKMKMVNGKHDSSLLDMDSQETLT